MQGSGQSAVASEGQSPAPTWPNFDPGLWTSVSGIIWVLLAIVALLVLRRSIADLLDAVIKRVRSGGALKFLNVELGPIRVSAKAPSSPLIEESEDLRGQWDKWREDVYQKNRLVFLAHRLFPSELAGQLYDVLIYLVPHEDRDASLRGVSSVDYYFGSAWKSRVFSSRDGGNRFGIVVSAYGKGFLCCARIHFSDKSSVDTWRYIDFEMGALGEGGIALASEAGSSSNSSRG